jgi:hypothetical protein
VPIALPPSQWLHNNYELLYPSNNASCASNCLEPSSVHNLSFYGCFQLTGENR